MRRLCLGVVGALVMLGSAPVAGADEPLNQYAVEGPVPGYDTREGSIAATPAEAARLRARGFDVRLVGSESTASAEAIVAGAPLADPTWGYDVFRPYNLNPAPCQTTCTGAVGATGAPISLKAFYDLRAAHHPTLVKRVVYGASVNGQELVAYRVTAGANESAEGSKPGVMFNAAQHAREWISPEVVRRGFDWVLAHSDDAASGIPAVLAASELWFVPAINPDGYDYTFQTRASRLWRKNLRDNNGNGTITGADGVDPNRNFPEKWRYDNEGASDDPSDETYRGRSPESEPEVSSFHALMARIRPEFHVDYHSYASLVLYPSGWQVETYGGDNPLMAALAGTDAHPAVAGYDPDVGGELYTTNGDITDTMYERLGILSYTVELDGGSGAPVGGTRSAGNTVGSNPGGFVFQDRESDVEAVFQKNLPFMLDLAKSAPTPDQPVSHIDAQIPDFVPTVFGVSYGDPQTVEVNVRRALGAVTVNWQVGSGPVHQGSTLEFAGGERYGQAGRYFHRVRGTVSGFARGDTVKVWFTAGGKTSDPFTFTASPHGGRVLILSAEDYGGMSPNTAPGSGPTYLTPYLDALADAGISADVYDVDAQGRNHADLLGVLSRYKAVIWYSGLDDYVRDPGQTVGVSKLFDDQMIAVRDYLNEGGKVLVTGQRALQGAWSGYSYNPLGRFPDEPQCRSNTSDVAPVGQLENCVQVSNDFLQYWMGASARATQASNATTVSALTVVGQSPFTSSFSLSGQAFLPRFTTTSAADFPQFASRATHLVSGNAVGVSTADTLLWGFGLENIADRPTRARLVREGLAHLGVHPVITTPTCACAAPRLELTLGAPATFGTFTPGVEREYTASMTANVIASPGSATLAVSAPGRLSNGAHMLREPLQVDFAPGPISNASVPIAFRQRIGASEPLHTGTYSRTLTFTLSSTTP